MYIYIYVYTYEMIYMYVLTYKRAHTNTSTHIKLCAHKPKLAHVLLLPLTSNGYVKTKHEEK